MFNFKPLNIDQCKTYETDLCCYCLVANLSSLCDPMDCSPGSSCLWNFHRGQEYPGGFPFPSISGDLPSPEMEPVSVPTFGSFASVSRGKSIRSLGSP